MAMTMNKIADLLDKKKIQHTRRDNGTISAGFETSNYLSPTGAKGLTVMIALEENGEYIKIFAPGAYSVPQDNEYVSQFLMACCQIQYRTKLAQFEYDETDGEVRPMVEFPLENNKITGKQLSRCIRGLAHLVDEFDPILRGVLNGQAIDFTAKEAEDSAKLQRLLDELDEASARASGANGAGAPSEKETLLIDAKPMPEMSDEELDKFA